MNNCEKISSNKRIGGLVNYMVIEILSSIAILTLGIWIGSFTVNHKSKYFNICLIILIVLFTWIGIDSFSVKIFDFQIRLSLTIQLILLGILMNRLLFLNVWKRRV